ncbi:cell division protein FtsN [Nitrosomonas stercoris]|uniref:Cell division protein FtsN n=1 Tax=Nitrosomonas stercoris TaxID=1444684 RepID=A0A4Y1YJ78_9PROT|nr:cell division protein FtsN [Nitrosomonas stercoris]
MSRNYKSRNLARTKKKGNPLWLGMFIGYTLGLMSAIAVWLYISQAPSPFLAQENPGKVSSQNQSGEKPTSLLADKGSAPRSDQQETNKPRFDFYKILPGVEEPPLEDTLERIPLPPTTVATEKKPEKVPERVATLKEKYYLQAGSFMNAGDAERMKAELAMLGVMASVQIGKTGNNAVVHRVRIGPFAKMEELDRVRASLQLNGVTTSLVRGNG